MDEKISVAGRLDPMAEGLLLLLIGEKNKKRKEYEKLSKQYTFKVLFGIQTDTYDLLGIPTITLPEILNSRQISVIRRFCREKIGTNYQEYPPYSSKPLNGKPLYYWARRNDLKGKKLPRRGISISAFEFNDSSEISGSKLLDTIQVKIPLVTGDFRQDEILTL